MSLLSILLGMVLTSGGDPSWDVLEQLRGDLAARGENSDRFIVSEQIDDATERESSAEVVWRLPDSIVLRDADGMESVIEAAVVPQRAIGLALQELLLRPVADLQRDYSAHLRPGRPGQVSIVLSRLGETGPASLRIVAERGRGRPMEVEIVDQSGRRCRLWIEQARSGFERPSAT